MSSQKPRAILCLASHFKGNRFLERCKREGVSVVLLTKQSLLGEAWSREYIDEIFGMPDFEDRAALLRAVSYLARTRHFDRIAPLDDFDVELVAQLREHLRIPVRLFLSFSGGKVRGEGTVRDISMGGCIIESQASVHVDDIFYLQIVLEHEQAPIEVAAMVRSVSSRGIAFKFLRSAQENKRLLAFVQAKTDSFGPRSPA